MLTTVPVAVALIDAIALSDGAGATSIPVDCKPEEIAGCTPYEITKDLFAGLNETGCPLN